MLTSAPTCPPRRQRGVVLFVAMVVLVVMTLIVLALMRGAVLELKIGGATQTSETLFSVAESATNAFINDNDGRYARDCLTDANPDLNCFTRRTGGANVSLGGTTDPAAAAVVSAPQEFRHGTVVLAETTLSARQLACVDDAGVGSGNQLGAGLQAVHFDIEARSEGLNQEAAVVNQGFKSLLPAGSC